MDLSEGGGTEENWMQGEQTWIPKNEDDERMGLGDRSMTALVAQVASIDDRDESRRDAPVPSRTRHFSGISGIWHYPV